MIQESWYLKMSDVACSSDDLISVIMPVYQAQRTVIEAIESVISQSIANWELLVVVDGDHSSPDYRYLSGVKFTDKRISILNIGNKSGVAKTRNFGIEHSRGRYIAFLDSDDIWDSNKLEIQVAAMKSAGARISCTAFKKWTESTGHKLEIGVPRWIDHRTLLKTNLICCSSAMFDKHAFQSTNMPELNRRQDFAFWLDLTASGDRILGVNQSLLSYRVGRDTLSSNKLIAAKDTWVVYRHYRKLPFLKAFWFFTNYSVRGLGRHKFPWLASQLGWLHSVSKA